MSGDPGPNFFIAGAPKCGTTALYAYLRQHPDVFMPDVKEPHFFGSDLGFRYRRRPSPEKYRSYFRGSAGRIRIGEASVWYLYSTRAATEIRAAVPDARIIAMVRNPVEMIPSLHAQFVYNGHEDLTLGEALDAQPARARGERIPPAANFPNGLLYTRVATFSEQLQRYFEVFGRDGVHVIVFDDFQASPATAYADAVQFLGISAEHAPDFTVVNPNKVVRSIKFSRLVNRPPEWARRIGRAVVPEGGRRRVHDLLMRPNIRYRPREAPDPSIQERIRILMSDEVERLGSLLGRDLGHWSRPRGADGASVVEAAGGAESTERGGVHA